MKQVEEELELTRLLAAEPSPLASAVSALRARVPDATEVGSLASRLALQGIDVAPHATPAPARAWKKWALTGAGGVSAMLVWLAFSAPPRLAPTSSHEAQLPAGSGVPRVAPARSVDAASASHGASASVAAGSLRPASPVSAPALGGPVDESPAASPRLEPAPPAAALANTPTEPSKPGASGATRASTPGSPATVDAPKQPPLSPQAAAAPTEIELLRDARLALRQSPARALDLAEQHARLYPQGKLTQERELIAISALVGLGRRTAALSRGARFERAFPSSPYRKQVGELLR